VKLAWEISSGFATGSLNVTDRPAHDIPGWAHLPETWLVSELRKRGESESFARTFVTLLAAMDRARDAYKLWTVYAPRLHTQNRWAGIPAEAVGRSLTDLADALKQSGVSQRHLMDSAAWRRIAESLTVLLQSPVTRVVHAGSGTATEILEGLQAKTSAGTARFPFLAGPKVGPMWLRMMVVPGGARVAGLKVVPVAVDVQVRRVTENLGVTDTRGRKIELIRQTIQDEWQIRAQREGVDGPSPLRNTCAALDPALWYFGRVGCSYCEDAGHRIPISPVCSACRLPSKLGPRRSRTNA
jgi:hypothetical protein